MIGALATTSEDDTSFKIAEKNHQILNFWHRQQNISYTNEHNLRSKTGGSSGSAGAGGGAT